MHLRRKHVGEGTGAPAEAELGQPGQNLPFSQELELLAHRFSECPARIETLLAATQGRGYHLLLILVTLPFLTPIPLPGFSIPFGLIVSVIGGRLALGQKPWLPQVLLNRELPPRFLTNLLKAARYVVRWLELVLRPRLRFLSEQAVFRRLAGALIALSGLFLILPMPLPFTNSLPACTVLLLAAGAMERDGVFLIGGCALFVVTVAFFALLALGGARTVEKVWQILPWG